MDNADNEAKFQMLHTHKSEVNTLQSPIDGHKISMDDCRNSPRHNNIHIIENPSKEKARPANLNFGEIGFTFNNEIPTNAPMIMSLQIP